MRVFTSLVPLFTYTYTSSWKWCKNKFNYIQRILNATGKGEGERKIIKKNEGN